MSAYLCPLKHYNSILKFIETNEDLFKYNVFYKISPIDIIECLFIQNVNSVNKRYNEQISNKFNKDSLKNNNNYKIICKEEFIRAIDCITYQSCETSDWYESKAYIFCLALKEAILRTMTIIDDNFWEID